MHSDRKVAHMKSCKCEVSYLTDVALNIQHCSTYIIGCGTMMCEALCNMLSSKGVLILAPWANGVVPKC